MTSPTKKRWKACVLIWKVLDYSLVKGGSVRSGNFNQLLKIAGERDEKELISEIVLRSQRQAIYDTENRGHFGLNLPRYAHFTSPIRRYADLTVHRALVTAGKLGDGGQTAKEAGALSDIAEQISNYERRAIAAEREANDRYLSSFLEERVGATFNARIRGVTKFGLFVMLDDSGADGFVPMRSIGTERYRFDEAERAIIGETTGGYYRLGMAVKVRLAEAVPLTGSLRFDMLSEPLPPVRKNKKSIGRKPGKKKSSRKSAKPKSKRAVQGDKKKKETPQVKRQTTTRLNVGAYFLWLMGFVFSLPITFSANAYKCARSSNCSNRAADPACPAPIFIRKINGPPFASSRNRATHFAGSQ